MAQIATKQQSMLCVDDVHEPKTVMHHRNGPHLVITATAYHAFGIIVESMLGELNVETKC